MIYIGGISLYIPINNKKQYKIPNGPPNASHHASSVSSPHHADAPNMNTIRAITPSEEKQLNQIEQYSKLQWKPILCDDEYFVSTESEIAL